jgi:hypothetical protein
VALSGGALGSTLHSKEAVCNDGDFLANICLDWQQLRGVKNPKGFGFYL